MKKNIFIFICMLFLSINLYAIDTTYEISAYKFTTENITMNVYDNLSGSLQNLGNSTPEKVEEIDITAYIKPLLYSGSTKISDVVSQSVFSIYVAGTERLNNTKARTYTVNVSITPFIHDESAKIIPVYYELGNIAIEYLGTGTNVSVSEVSSGTKTATANSSSPVSLGHSWSVQRTNNSAPNTITWESKCSVAAGISNTDYDNADTGAYTANVTITLEVK